MRLSPITLLSLFLPFLLIADDWPTFRHDAQRSAISAETIDFPLHPSWSHVPLAPPARAWTPPKSRNFSADASNLVSTQDYDSAFHAIAAAGRIFYATSSTDSLCCLDPNGRQVWRFFAEGPLRFAPVYSDGQVYVGSDDGQVYCVDADSGDLVWQHRAGPENRRIPGNGRLISEWPVRGGLVVDQGLVYFGAGVFPDHGSYAGALDAKTGKAAWTRKIGVSPQGYLLTTDERIFVPTGRTPFQELNRADGQNVAKLGRSNSWGKRLHGGCLAVVVGGQLASGPSEDGQIDVFKKAKSVVRMPGRQLLVDDGVAYVLGASGIEAIAHKELAAATRGKADQAVLWSRELATPRCMVKTHEALLIGGAGWLAAHSLAAGKERWRVEMSGAVESVAVSDGQVYACTNDGRIHCFTSLLREPQAEQPPPRRPSAGEITPLAAKILAATPVRKGYILVLGVESGKTVADLARRTQCRVVARDADPAKVHAVRDYLVDQGLYGTHAVVHQGAMDALPYTDFLANIVTSESSTPPTPMAECERLVRPHGGLLYLQLAKELKSWTRPALPGAGSWSHFYGDPGNTACSNDSRGTETMRLQWFGRPGPEKMVDRHNKTTSPLYKNGRMIVPGLDFFVAADAYNGTILWEKDVPNSVRIGAMRDSSNMALGDDALFIATAGECLKIDPQSGRELSRLTTARLFGEPDSTWGYVATVDGLVYGSVSRAKAIVRQEVRGRDAIWRRVEPLVVCSDRVFAASTKTDELAWQYQPESGMIINPTIAIADGRVTFIQSDNPATTTVSNAQIGLGPLLKMASMVALDAKTGRTLWKRAVELHDITDAIYLSSSADTLLVTGTHYRKVSKEERVGLKKPEQALRCRYEVFAFDAKSGAPKWHRLIAPNRDWELNGGHGINIQHPALVNGVVYGPGFAMRIDTGEDFDGWKWSVSHKCGTISASAKYAFSRFSAEKFCYMFDLKDGASKPLSKASRPGCWINILPVGGLVLVPEASAGCTCEYSVQSSMAFLPQ